MNLTDLRVLLLIFFVSGMFLSGCATTVNRSPSPYGSHSPKTLEDQSKMDKDDLRMMAAANLTDQGKALLTEGKVDDAISVFERSMNINAQNGKNYYYLARAWLKKGNISLAEEFNRLASIHAKNDKRLSRLVDLQKHEISAYKDRNK